MTMQATTKRLLFAMGIMALLLVSYLPTVLAIPSPATGLTAGTSSRRNLSTSDVTNISAQAGNVTRLDINGISITTSWQGYYGNISGNILLSDADNNSLYEWGNGTTITGEIFASRNDTIDWGSINCSNSTQVSAEETYLGQASGDGDSVTNTYNETDHPAFLVGARNMHTCPSTNAWSSGTRDPNSWHQVMLADTNDKIVYSTIIDQGSTGYDGNGWDFQLLVAENEKTGNEGPTTYYFFTELG